MGELLSLSYKLTIKNFCKQQKKMASNKVVISALLVVIVSVLAATTTMADHHQEQVVYTPGQLCQPGIGYPTYPLPRCRAFVKRQCVAPGTVDEQILQGCCRQLAAIDSSWCRCDALNHMLRIIYSENGAADVGHPMAEVFRGCRRGDIERATASLPAFCNVDIPNGVGGVCYWLPRTGY